MQEVQLIEKLNQLQAQVLGLMNAVATLASAGDAGCRQRLDYEMRCSMTQAVIAAGPAPIEALPMQRREFARVGNIVFGSGELGVKS